MAQSLEKTFSPGRCVRFSKRFIRLCTQVNGTQVLIPDVQNAINDVSRKNRCTMLQMKTLIKHSISQSKKTTISMTKSEILLKTVRKSIGKTCNLRHIP
jgi:hypothetical protein